MRNYIIIAHNMNAPEVLVRTNNTNVLKYRVLMELKKKVLHAQN